MPASTGQHDPYAALRNPQYTFYAAGSLLVLMGSRMQAVAVLWEMHQRTGQPLALGLVGLVLAAPVIGLALPAGHVADRLNRRTLVIVSLLLTTLTSLGLAAVSLTRAPVGVIYLILFLDAAFLTMGRPARMALLPQLVAKEVFPNAVTWQSSIFQVASVLGPAVGGLVVRWNAAAAYFICAGCTTVFAIVMSQLTFRPYERPAGAPTSSVQSLVEGLRFVWRSRVVFTIISLDLFAVLLGGATYLLPIYADNILHVGATGYGYLEAAPAAGAFLMALVIAHLPPMKRAGRDLLLAVAAFGGATIVFGLSRSFVLSLAMLFVLGAADNISVVVRHTLVQLLTPDHLRGRISAVNSIFIVASNDIGGFESGTVAQWLGPVASVVIGGVGTLVVVATTAVVSPRLRRFGALHEAEPEAFHDAPTVEPLIGDLQRDTPMAPDIDDPPPGD